MVVLVSQPLQKDARAAPLEQNICRENLRKNIAEKVKSVIRQYPPATPPFNRNVPSMRRKPQKAAVSAARNEKAGPVLEDRAKLVSRHMQKSMGRDTGPYRNSTTRLRRAWKGVRMAITLYGGQSSFRNTCTDKRSRPECPIKIQKHTTREPSLLSLVRFYDLGK